MRLAGRAGFFTTTLMLGLGVYIVARNFDDLHFCFGRPGAWDVLPAVVGAVVTAVPSTLYILLVRWLSNRSNRAACFFFAVFSFVIYFFPLSLLMGSLSEIYCDFIYESVLDVILLFFALGGYLGIAVFLIWAWELFKKRENENMEKQLNKDRDGIK